MANTSVDGAADEALSGDIDGSTADALCAERCPEPLVTASAGDEFLSVESGIGAMLFSVVRCMAGHTTGVYMTLLRASRLAILMYSLIRTFSGGQTTTCPGSKSDGSSQTEYPLSLACPAVTTASL